MGVYNRDYMRDEGGPPRGGGLMSGPANWSVITWLLVINCVVFLVQHLFLAPAEATRLGWSPWGGLSWDDLKGGQVWLLLTHMFVHGSLFHLLANGLGIYFIGRMLVSMLGVRHFLMVYFGAGIMGGFAQLAFSQLVAGENVYLIGASGCVYGLLCALATLIPNQVINVLLFFVIPIRARMKTIALVAVGVGVVMTIVGLATAGGNASGGGVDIGHMAHLGGALFGFLFIAVIYPNLKRKKHDQSRRQRWDERFGASKVVDADYVDKDAERRRRERARKKRVSKDIDAILDKISAEGMHSLTKEERKILDESSDNLG